MEDESKIKFDEEMKEPTGDNYFKDSKGVKYYWFNETQKEIARRLAKG